MAQVQLLYVDGSVEKVDKESAEALQALRQTTALLTASALHQQFDGIRLGDNQATDDGFFIDSDKDEVQVSADELEAVAAIVKSFGKDKAKVEFESADLTAAKALYPNDQFQQELFEDNAQNGKVPLFKVGDFATIASGAVLNYVDVVKNF